MRQPERIRRCVAAAFATVVAVGVTGLFGASAAHADPVTVTDHEVTVTRTLPAGVTQAWIDVEASGTPVDAVTATATSSEAPASVDFKATTFGLTAVVPAAPGQFVFHLTALKALDAHLALTFADASGAILDGWDEHIVLTPAPTGGETTPPPPTSEPTATANPTVTVNPTAPPSPSSSASATPPPASPTAGSPSQGNGSQPGNSSPSSSGPVVGSGGSVVSGAAPIGIAVAALLVACGCLLASKKIRGRLLRALGDNKTRGTVAGVVAFVLVASMIGVVLAPPAQAEPAKLTPVADSAGLSDAQRVPAVESQAGVGAKLSTNDDASVALPGLAGADGALVRVSVLGAAADAQVFATGAPALTVKAGESASTAVLAPVADSAIPLRASAALDVRLEVLATFDGDAATPGSVVTLDQPVSRANTQGEDLAGTNVGPDGVAVGLVGEGSIPSTGVRAVFLTATITAPAAGAMSIAGQAVPVPAGRTSVTTVAVPDDAGAAQVSYRPGSGTATAELRVDLRGWVPEAPQNSSKSNVVGGYVPSPASDPVDVSVPRHTDVPLTLPTTDDTALAVAMVSADSSPTPSLLNLGQPYAGRGHGAVVDPAAGALPQLTVAPASDHKVVASVRDAAVNAHVQWLGGFVGAAAETGAPSVTILYPTQDGTVDMAATQGLTMAGTVAGGTSVESVTLYADDELIGSATLTYTGTEIRWSFVTSAPVGQQQVTVTVTDRAGQTASSTVSFEVLAPQPDTVILDPDTVVLPAAVDGVDFVASLTDDTVTFNAEPTMFVPGSVIVSDSVPGAPQGFLRLVDAIDKVGDQWVVQTSPAALTDAIWQCDEDDTVDLMAAGNSSVTPVPEDDPSMEVVDEGAKDFEILSGDEVDVSPYSLEAPDDSDESETPGSASPAPTTQANPTPGTNGRPLPLSFGVDTTLSKSFKESKVWSWDASNKPKDLSKASDSTKQAAKNAIEVSAGVSLSGEAQASLSLRVAVKISITWNWAIPTPKVNDFRVVLTATVKATAALDANVKASWEKTLDKELYSINFPTLTFAIGPVPVVITSSAGLYVEASASISAEGILHIEIGAQRVQTYGFSYSTDGGFKNLNSEKSTVDLPKLGEQSLTAGIKAEAKATFGPRLEFDVALYDAAGPVFSAGVQAGITGDFTATNNLTTGTTEMSANLDAFLEVYLDGKVQLKVPIIDKILLSADMFHLSKTFPLFSWCWSSADGLGKCEPGGSSSPSPSESPSSTPSIPSTQPTDPVNIPDRAFRQCLNSNLGQDAESVITIAQLEGLEWVSCPYERISSIEGSQYLRSLAGLYMYNSQIVDVSPLAGLSNLTTLSLFSNQIVDVSPLAGLSNLTDLRLDNNQIVDVSPLAGLSNLDSLELEVNQIVDVSPLAGLSNLTTLYLGNNRIVDVSPLAGLSNLDSLELEVNRIVDVSPLAGLSNLTDLRLGNNRIVDVSPLAGLTHLTTLYLENNRIVDVSPLAGLTHLLLLSLNSSQDVSSLENFSCGPSSDVTYQFCYYSG